MKDILEIALHEFFYVIGAVVVLLITMCICAGMVFLLRLPL